MKFKDKTLTNADRIRAMSDEELAHCLHSYKECAGDCIVGAGLKDCFFRCENQDSLVDWLRAPACAKEDAQ